MAYEGLLSLSIILFVGFVLGKLVDLLKIPEITGYIIAGVLLGPSVLNIITTENLESLKIIMSLVLGIIAYTLGSELWLPKIKKNGKKIIIITLFESLTTTFLVLIVLLAFGIELWLALLLAAIATATAPAAAMAIAKKLKAKGPVTNVAIPVIGMDDIVAVLVFGVFSSLAVSLVNIENQAFNLWTALADPLIGVSLAVLIGTILGIILIIFSKYSFSKMAKKERYLSYLSVVLSFILFILWLTNFLEVEFGFHVSALLTPLVMGMVFTNFSNKETFQIQSAAMSNFAGPFTILLFTMAGVELSVTVLLQAGLPALLYIVVRIIGKFGGAYLGAVVSKAEPVVKKNVGLTLLTQGGVEIGMIVAVLGMMPHDKGVLVQTIVLSGILVFELIGPILFKNTIVRVGEATALYETDEPTELVEAKE